jgi:hypothetical protein
VLGATGISAGAELSEIPGLLSPDADGLWALDPEALDVPGVRSATVEFDRRGVERVMVTSRSRGDCQQLLAWLEQSNGQPAASGCAERRWNEPGYNVRYAERPEFAMCTATFMVGEPLRTPLPDPIPAVDRTRGLGPVQLGARFDSFGGLVPLERFQVAEEEPVDEGEERISSWRMTESPGHTDRWWSLADDLGGAELYGVELRFWSDALEEMTVRATEEGCDLIRAELIERFGEGESGGTPANRTWQGCDVVLDYRYSPALLACRATIRSQESEWRRAEARVVRRDADIAANRAAVEALVEPGKDGWAVLKPAAVAWVQESETFVDDAPHREPVFVAGEPQGFRLVGVAPDSLEHALGLRDGDHVVRLNTKAAEAFKAKKDLRNLRIAVRRGGVDQLIQVRMPPGFHDAVLALRGAWP